MTKLNVAVIDYESGNLRSVSRALGKAGVQPAVTSDPALVEAADAVVLPGVGSGSAAMRALHLRKLVEPLRKAAASGKPMLCVCLGLHLLMDDTQEGGSPCLGIIAGSTKKLPSGLKVPHMGWNNVAHNNDHPLLCGIPHSSYFYFVHSYYGQPADPSLAVGITEYGLRFCSILVQDNVMATQFHPEKSGDMGLKIYQNFVDYALKASETRHAAQA